MFVETIQARRAGDRDEPRLLSEQPGERDLRGGGVLFRGDLVEQIDQHAIGPQGIGREARQ